jgi:hypothetical protein
LAQVAGALAILRRSGDGGADRFTGTRTSWQTQFIVVPLRRWVCGEADRHLIATAWRAQPGGSRSQCHFGINLLLSGFCRLWTL